MAGLPLDESHVQAANMLLDIERRTMPVLQAINDCGVDCRPQMSQLTDAANFARSVKRNFMSDQM